MVMVIVAEKERDAVWGVLDGYCLMALERRGVGERIKGFWRQ